MIRVPGAVSVYRRRNPAIRALLPLLFVASTLAACKSITPPESGVVRDAATLSNWQASGRIAVSGVEAGGSGSFTWIQRGEEAAVQLRGPVGIGSLKLTISDHALRVATADGDEFVAEDAERELVNRLGASVPAQDLRFWLVGQNAPGEHEWSKSPEAATLTQHRWRIDYQRYAVTDNVRLPTKLVASSGPAKVRIVVDKWKLR